METCRYFPLVELSLTIVLFLFVTFRKRPADVSASEFDSAMKSVFQTLMNFSRDFLHKSSSNAGFIDESEFEFAEYICESMVSLGSSNLQCIASDSTLLPLYLQQVIGLFNIQFC